MGHPSWELAGQTPETIYEAITKAGVSDVDASVLVSSWIFQNFGRTKRVFDYRQPFAEQDASCAAAFDRTFTHEDWTDGESVVQAEKTVGEDGFNVRFHLIEADLDALGNDVKQTFACLAALRQELHTLLGELRTEINRINADVFELGAPSTAPTVKIPPYVELLDQPYFLGTAKIGNEDRYMWKTQQGVVMLPAQHVIGVGPDEWRVKYSGAFNAFVHDERVRNAFPQGTAVTKEALVEQFGNELTEDGVLVRSLVDILPDDASFDSLDAMAADVAERNAAVIRTSTATKTTTATVLGIDAVGTSAADASLADFGGVPANTRVALMRDGIETIGNLADATPERIVEAAKANGVEVGLAEAANLRGIAMTLRHI